MRVAQQTIHHLGAYPTYMLLPVVPWASTRPLTKVAVTPTNAVKDIQIPGAMNSPVKWIR